MLVDQGGTSLPGRIRSNHSLPLWKCFDQPTDSAAAKRVCVDSNTNNNHRVSVNTPHPLTMSSYDGVSLSCRLRNLSVSSSISSLSSIADIDIIHSTMGRRSCVISGRLYRFSSPR
jgi:hypothetical protein